MKKEKTLKKALIDEANASIAEFIMILFCCFVAFSLVLAPSPNRQRQIAIEKQVHSHHI